MRAEALICLAFAACTNNVTDPDSVRDRLASDTTELAVATASSAGSLPAERRASNGWVAGEVALTVKSGELVASADARGQIAIQHLGIELGPISIPKSVLGYEALLTDIHLQADRPAGVVTTWTGDDEAHATA